MAQTPLEDGGPGNERGPRTLAVPVAGRRRGHGGREANERRGWRMARHLLFLGLVGAVAHVRLSREFELLSAAAIANSPNNAAVLPHGNTSSTPAVANEAPLSLPYLPKQAKRWADTPSGDVCNQLLPWGPYPRDSFVAIWEALRPSVLNESYIPFRIPFREDSVGTAADQKEVQEFRHWTSSLFHFYTYERLRRTQAHPAPAPAMRKILHLARDRIHDPDRHEPVRVAFMGGSVASGLGSHFTPFSITNTKVCFNTCDYVPRLRHFLNTILFPSNRTFPVFEVLNLAAGGTNSEVGAMAFQYDLIPTLQHKPPHIVVSSYSANDASDPDLRKTFREDQQAFVRATHNLRPCDDDLPLLVLSDDYYGPDNIAERALEQTGSIYKTASWHNVMAVTYPNAARHRHELDEGLALHGRDFDQHLGMGFHFGQAWTLFFNLLAALHDTCGGTVDSDDALRIGAETNESSSAEPPDRRKWHLKELPTKYRGRYDASVSKIQREWSRNVLAKELRCQQLHNRSANGDENRPAEDSTSRYRTRVCEYAWMANKATPFNEPDTVRNAMNHVLVSNEGWTVTGEGIPGEPETYARTGWVANNSQARFAVEIKDLRQAVTSFTVLSMKSYGPDWIDSKLRATVEVVPREGPTVAAGQLVIDGYHELRTSVNFPHRLLLNHGGAKVGDTIRVAFELVNGRTFKISGLAFCQLDDE